MPPPPSARSSSPVHPGTSTSWPGATWAWSTAAPRAPNRSRNALQAVGTELVAIHDAARPLVTPELIEDVVATLAADPEAAGAIAATPVTDTIKQVVAAESRSVWRVREPKGSARRRVDPGSRAALGGSDAAGVPGRGAAGGAGGRSRAGCRCDGRGDAGRGGGREGADPSLAAREPQGDDAARPEAGRAVSWRSAQLSRPRRARRRSRPGRRPRAMPRLSAPSAAGDQGAAGECGEENA